MTEIHRDGPRVAAPTRFEWLATDLWTRYRNWEKGGTAGPSPLGSVTRRDEAVLRSGLEVALIDPVALERALAIYRIDPHRAPAEDRPLPHGVSQAIQRGVWVIPRDEFLRLLVTPFWITGLATALDEGLPSDTWAVASDRWAAWSAGAVAPPRPVVASLHDSECALAERYIRSEIELMFECFGSETLTNRALIRAVERNLLAPVTLSRPASVRFFTIAAAVMRDLVRLRAVRPMTPEPMTRSSRRTQK